VLGLVTLVLVNNTGWEYQMMKNLTHFAILITAHTDKMSGQTELRWHTVQCTLCQM